MAAVPKGTTKLDIRMVDLNVPSFPHGGAEIAYTGQSTLECGDVARASLGVYRGPSPPPGEIHVYEWTINALDASGKILGRSKTQLRYPQ